MNISAYFFTFSKRKNSTKKPTGDGSEYTIALKDSTSILTPTIEIVASGPEFMLFNYVYIPWLHRYYYITDMRSIAKYTYEADLTCDYLATWIADVLGQSVYAQMSSYAYETQLDDDRVVPTTDITHASEVGAFDIISGGTSSLTIPCYQFLSIANNAGLLNGIDIFFGLSLVSDYLQKCSDQNWAQTFGQTIAGVNPFDAVNGAWWSPLIPQQCHSVGSNSGMIYDVPISGSCLASPDVKTHYGSVAVPKPSVNDFRYSSKYVKYYLNLPYIGVITIPTELLVHRTAIDYAYAGDCMTGEVAIAPTVNGVSLGMFGTSLKAPIQLARQSSHTAQIVSQGIAAGGSLAAVGGKVAGAGGAIIGAAAGFAAGTIRGVCDMPSIDRVGSAAGSLAPLGCRRTLGQIELHMIESEADVDPASFISVAGRPTQKIVTLQSGYVQTAGASVHFGGTETEINSFNAALDGGIYIE